MSQPLRVYLRIWPYIQNFHDGKKIYDFLKKYGDIEIFHIRREIETRKYQRIGFVQYKESEKVKHLVSKSYYSFNSMTMKVEMSDPITNIYGDASVDQPSFNVQRTWAWKGFYMTHSTFIGEMKQKNTMNGMN
ncbi:5123_t:CDS:2 [Paraglomus occultum]|uniref:5123_t:CDS:1 n=1 Tax=Paraglomus occultum TaxID=144539 RepID=A0A9N9F8I8_9GLOM|nr:5123_t:CDS:2 [Paraglomus occultum]